MEALRLASGVIAGSPLNFYTLAWGSRTEEGTGDGRKRQSSDLCRRAKPVLSEE
jgi:hypothetical protein